MRYFKIEKEGGRIVIEDMGGQRMHFDPNEVKELIKELNELTVEVRSEKLKEKRDVEKKELETFNMTQLSFL